MTDPRSAVIAGWAHTPFGKSEAPDIEALIAAVGADALAHAGVGAEDVDYVTVGVLNSGFARQGFEAGLVSVAVPGLEHAPAMRTENACATGSAALHAAMDFVEAGRGRVALVIGAEKMTATPTAEVGDILLGASYRKEEAGIEGGFAGLFGQIAGNYFQRHGDHSEELAMIAAKNHANGTANPMAHMRKDLGFDFCNTVSERTRMSPGRCGAPTVRWSPTAPPHWWSPTAPRPRGSRARSPFAPAPIATTSCPCRAATRPSSAAPAARGRRP